MFVSHDGVWTGGANDCNWRRSGAKLGVPGRQTGEVCQLTSRGVFKHGMLGHWRSEERPGSGAGWKERGQAARSAPEAACGVDRKL